MNFDQSNLVKNIYFDQSKLDENIYFDTDFHNLAPVVGHNPQGTVPETLTCHTYICEKIKIIKECFPSTTFIVI